MKTITTVSSTIEQARRNRVADKVESASAVIAAIVTIAFCMLT